MENWPAGRTDLLEYAIQAASEILSDVEDDERGPPAEESGGMMAPPEDPIETTEFVEADLIHSLIEKNHSMQDIYGLLIPEIELIGEGAERAADRRDNGDSETPDAPAVGNRGGSHTAMFH